MPVEILNVSRRLLSYSQKKMTLYIYQSHYLLYYAVKNEIPEFNHVFRKKHPKKWNQFSNSRAHPETTPVILI